MISSSAGEVSDGGAGCGGGRHSADHTLEIVWRRNCAEEVQVHIVIHKDVHYDALCCTYPVKMQNSSTMIGSFPGH